MFLLSLFTFDDVDYRPTRTEYVNRLEFNHVLDPRNGKELFTQVITWRKYESVNEEHVGFFWSVKERPLFNHGEREHYVFKWHEHRLIIVKASTFIETWTFRDPELDDRQMFPKDERQGLNRYPNGYYSQEFLEDDK